MNNIIQELGSLCHPVKALVVYQKDNADKEPYVEAYDMDESGYPINGHPLSLREATFLSKALDTTKTRKANFLKSEGIIPAMVLYTDNTPNGFAIWYSPAQRKKLLFKHSLGIESGMVSLPPLVWKATKDSLYIYTLKEDARPDEETYLYHAPFFNLYEDGRVCMGTVQVSIPSDCGLYQFISLWEDYFFNSYFSHLIGSHSPVKGNIVQLWQGLMNTRKKFPVKQLVSNGITLQNLLS